VPSSVWPAPAVIRILTDRLPVAAELDQLAEAANGDVRVDARIRCEAMTRSDWTTHDYNVHFCLGLENTGDRARQVELSVNGGTWDALPDTAPVLYQAAERQGPYSPSEIPARTDLRKRYALRARLDGGERLYLANFLPRDLDALWRSFDSLGESGGAKRQIIGRSIEGRPLVAYVYGDTASRGSLLVTSGFHPPEPDTLASEAIMDYLATPGGASLAAGLAVVVLPVVNPDGFANGTQAANAAGINFYWHFAREEPVRCPEAAALWEFTQRLRPRGYIDFHGYTFQRNKRAGPYLRPPFFYSGPEVRAAAAAIYHRMTTTDGTVPVTGFSTYAPHTLGSMLAERFDTITATKFHVHLADGVDACRIQGLAAFRSMAEGLIRAGLTTVGSPISTNWRRPVRRLREFWAGCLRPNLGLLRRGRLGEIQTTCLGLVDASGRAELAPQQRTPGRVARSG
jgi:hypothetical protein